MVVECKNHKLKKKKTGENTDLVQAPCLQMRKMEAKQVEAKGPGMHWKKLLWRGLLRPRVELWMLARAVMTLSSCPVCQDESTEHRPTAPISTAATTTTFAVRLEASACSSEPMIYQLFSHRAAAPGMSRLQRKRTGSRHGTEGR